MQFRYQMEERDGGFSYYCSQRCLERSQRAGSDDGSAPAATCDACRTRFLPELVSQVFYVQGRRHYACGAECRAQLVQEASGARLGDLGAADPPRAPMPSAPVPVAAKTTPSSLPPPLPGPSATPRVLAVFNHKGGTGKTTTAVSIAAGLARQGRRVLLVDTDAQGNVAVSLGASSERSLYHVLVMGLAIQQAVKPVRENLDLLPSNETLAAAELYLAGRQNRDRVLRERLYNATQGYDYVVIDCSPSLSLMNQNALVFADSVLVPVACDYLSLVGVRQVIKTIKNVNSLLHHPVQIYGVLPTFYDARARICRDAWGTMKEHFGERCFNPIRNTTRIKEAPAQGKTIFEHAPDSNAAQDYLRAVERIITGRCAEADVDGEVDEAMTG